MQATVRSFSPDTRSGTLFLDDGSLRDFTADAFDRGGLRLLRVGQRVRLRLDEHGNVAALTLATLPV